MAGKLPLELTRTVDVAPLQTRATVVPNSANEEKRTIDITWTTGARVMRGYYDRFWEELSLEPKHVRMSRLNNGAPFLRDHRMSVDTTAGVVEPGTATLLKKEGRATIRFVKAGVDPEADRLFEKMRDLIVQNVSVGYRVFKMEKTEDGADKIPVYRAVDWEPYEISAVASGADDGAGVRSAGNETNPCVFVTRQESSTMEKTPEQIAAEQAAEAKRQQELKDAQTRAVTAERERVSGIQHAVRVAKLKPEFAQKLVDEGVAVDAARALVLEEIAKRSDETPTTQHVQVTADRDDKYMRGVSAWLFERSGKSALIDQAKKAGAKGFENVETDGAEFRGMTILDIARESLERRGISTRGMYNRHELIKLAIRGGGYSGTSDFSVLFENVMYKTMRAAYAVQSDSWRRFCGTDTVADFRLANRFLNGTFGTLDVVAENGEYQNKAIPDGAKTSISTETRGNIISISRQALINDDMGALSDLAVRFGRSAGLSIEAAVYALLQQNAGLGPTLSDSNTFFHATRGNIGTGAALSVASLIADKVLMRKQQDISSNEYLDLLPRILLVPAALEADANLINVNQTDPTASATTGKQNMARGMFGDIVSSPRLTSATRRWMFTEGKEAFKVVFLEGSGEGPTMESEEGFDVDGLRWKARIDFKVNPYDPKTALTNAGA